MSTRERVLEAARRFDEPTADNVAEALGLDRDVVRRQLSALVRSGAMRVVRRGRGREASVYAFVSKPRSLGPGRGNRTPRRSIPRHWYPQGMRLSVASKIYDGLLELDAEARRTGRPTLQQAENRFRREPVPPEQALRRSLEVAHAQERAFFEWALGSGHASLWTHGGRWAGYVLSYRGAARWMSFVTACTDMARAAASGLGSARFGSAEAFAAFITDPILTDDEQADVQGCDPGAIADRRRRQKVKGVAFPENTGEVPAELTTQEAALKAAAEAGLTPRRLENGHVLFFLPRPGFQEVA